MPYLFELAFSGDQDAARAAVAEGLAEQGFTLAPGTRGRLVIERGNGQLSLVAGSDAADRFYVRFALDFSVRSDGYVVARLTRSRAGGVLLGGFTGAMRSQDAFETTCRRLLRHVEREPGFVTALASEW